jgi:hypothetical protein
LCRGAPQAAPRAAHRRIVLQLQHLQHHLDPALRCANFCPAQATGPAHLGSGHFQAPSQNLRAEGQYLVVYCGSLKVFNKSDSLGMVWSPKPCQRICRATPAHWGWFANWVAMFHIKAFR